MYEDMDQRDYDYREGRGRGNRRGDYRDDYREDYRMYRDEYGRNQRDRRNYRGYRDRRSYRSEEYAMMLEDAVDDTMELARCYEDMSEMASDNADKQKLMKMAEREKEHHRYIKEMLEKAM
jgi:hypothetical protein